ncbi:MAG: 30S ribosomal protein S3 [bacterium]|nr:30S ribosomal protein S3 [bacterium]
MSHIVHPYAHRLGIIKDWKSRWFGVKGEYQKFLRCDILVREFLAKRLRGMFVSSVDIERGPTLFRIIIRTSRPGLLIGRSGEGAVKLKNELLGFMRKHKLSGGENFKLDIEEVRSPESNAAIVAQLVSEGLEKRLPFRRVMKQTLDKVMANRDVLGVKVYLGGRLGGAEMARTEELKRGRIPLQTLRADIDFARMRAHMTYGDIGIKVWIYKGEIFEDTEKPKK